ncbi:MAG: hypothetical protein ACFFBY_14790 [Promethearchaeota archaeon]
MTFIFKVRFLVIFLFIIYASCTSFMVRMDLIPSDMLLIEIFDTLVIFLISMALINKIDLKENRNEK